MDRRHFIKTGVASFLAPQSFLGGTSLSKSRSQVITVQGARSPGDLGLTLMHEHILVDFIGADKVSRDRYDPDEVFRAALPYLKKLRSLGCQTLVECTPAYLGRDPSLLNKLSEASGLHLLTNTGYYGAAEDKYVPSLAYSETDAQLAARWTREFREGIDGTEIRPGIMKIGVDPGVLSEIDAKLVRAAAMTHLQTGLTIASHTGDGVAALQELEVLKKEGVSPEAFIWVHAQIETDVNKHFKAAEEGAWVEFDGVSEEFLMKHLELVEGMIKRGLLQRTLVSQDAGWYHVGEKNGGSYRSYEYLLTHFVPELKKARVSEKQIRTLLIDNPRRVLALQIKSLKA